MTTLEDGLATEEAALMLCNISLCSSLILKPTPPPLNVFHVYAACLMLNLEYVVLKALHLMTVLVGKKNNFLLFPTLKYLVHM